MPLSPSMGAGSYVSDFVHSKNSKFKGKSKKKRIDMALGAFYGAKKENPSPYNEGNLKYSPKRKRRGSV